MFWLLGSISMNSLCHNAPKTYPHLDGLHDGVDTNVMYIGTTARVRIFCDMWRRIFQCGLPALLTNVYRINQPPYLDPILENLPTKMIQGAWDARLKIH